MTTIEIKSIHINDFIEYENKIGKNFIFENPNISNGTYFLGYTFGKFPQYYSLLWNRWEEGEDKYYERSLSKFLIPSSSEKERGITEVLYSDIFYEVFIEMYNNSIDHNQRFWKLINF